MSRFAARHRGRRTAVLVVAAVTAGLCAFPALTANAADPDPNPSALETQNAELSRRAGTESMVLLENSDGTLPLAGSAAEPTWPCSAWVRMRRPNTAPEPPTSTTGTR